MTSEKRVVIVDDLSFGDAGKGTIVDAVVKFYNAHTVVRFNGGAQAAHNIVTPDGRHHTFSQFGAGMFIENTRTHLSRFMLVEPIGMMVEERHLREVGVNNAFERTTIDEDSLIITPFHRAANRLLEISRGDGRHGSCGMGIGQTMLDSLIDGGRYAVRARDFRDFRLLERKLRQIQGMKLGQLTEIIAALPRTDAVVKELDILRDTSEIDFILRYYRDFADVATIVPGTYLAELLAEPGMVVFEAAQGVLIDEWHGFHPYTTWSTTTLKNAETLLAEAKYDGKVQKLGVTRAYATRHGAGPFVSESAELTQALPDYHNGNHEWQKAFRVGYLDFVMLRYALNVAGKFDGLAVTHLDRMSTIDDWKVVDAYELDIRKGDWTLQQLDEALEYQETDVQGIIKITRVKAHFDEDLVRQERLTRMLQASKPLYTPVAYDERKYLADVSEKLGLPIAITSSGTSRREKKFFNV